MRARTRPVRRTPTNTRSLHRDLFPAQVVERQLVARLIQDLFERRTLHFEPAKKRLTAEPEFFGDDVHASPGPPGLMACCDAELPSAVLTAPAELEVAVAPLSSSHRDSGGEYLPY